MGFAANQLHRDLVVVALGQDGFEQAFVDPAAGEMFG